MSRVVWTVLVVVFAVMAVIGPYKMLRLRSAAAPSEKAADTGSTQTAKPAGNKVAMAGLKFTPGELTVARGTEVLFDNDDLAPHTVTSTDKKIDSGILNPGKAFSLVIQGPLEYFCVIHPGMTGKILLTG